MTLSQSDLLSGPRIEEALASLPHWELKGKQIVRCYEFKSFADAMEAANSIARIAEDRNHHPDIHISHHKVKVLCWTHKLGGLTRLDMDLAAEVEKAVLGG